MVKCPECNKEFSTHDAMEKHSQAKHSKVKSKTTISRKKLKKIALTLIILILIALPIYAIYSNSKKPGKYDEFAQCLTVNDATMYGTEWCIHCKAQKDMFGKSFEYVNYVDCDRNRAACTNAGVTGYPTWVIANESYAGQQPLERLSIYSGCELNPQNNNPQ